MSSIFDLEYTYKKLLATGRSFVFYHEPADNLCYLLMSGKKRNLTFQSIEELDGQRGFVIAPFHVDKEHPIVLIRADEEVSGDYIDVAIEPLPRRKRRPMDPQASDEDYSQRFETFIGALHDGMFDKLVLSRPMQMSMPRSFRGEEAFFEACHRYPHSYVYLCYTPETGGWLGSTPEILLSKSGGFWKTVALAGTQPLLKGKKLPQCWDEKQRQEQEYVSDYIRRQLDSLNIKFIEKGPYPAYAGALSHLRTDFYFFLPDTSKLGHLLATLHPTPAVCGLPKEDAYRFILEKEGYDRQYYSGFIGCLSPDYTRLYVNLRCMKVEDKALTLYAGGGLLASSELDDEFQETEKKMLTMKRLMINVGS